MNYSAYEADLWKAIALNARMNPQGVADDAFMLGREVFPGVDDQLTINAVRGLQSRNLLKIFHLGIGPDGRLMTMLTPNGLKTAELIR